MAYVFPKLETAKDVARQMFKSPASEEPFRSNMENGP